MTKEQVQSYTSSIASTGISTLNFIAADAAKVTGARYEVTEGRNGVTGWWNEVTGWRDDEAHTCVRGRDDARDCKMKG